MYFTRVGFSLTRKHWTRLEIPTRDKHSSLLRKSVNYDCKMFFSTGPWCASTILVNIRPDLKIVGTNTLAYFGREWRTKKCHMTSEPVRKPFRLRLSSQDLLWLAGRHQSPLRKGERVSTHHSNIKHSTVIIRTSLHWRCLARYRTWLCTRYRSVYNYLCCHIAQGGQGK